MVKSTALLIDISSIQEYVFGSNKLKMNIGASYIIEKEVWKVGKADIKLDYEEVYIGGGNALFTFSEKDQTKQFVNAFTKNVFLYFPGLKISAAVIENYNSTDKEAFKNSRISLNKKMTVNKSLYPANPFLPKEGIFTDCGETNEYQECNSLIKDEGIISKVAYAKLAACKRAQEEINDSLSDKSFAFTDELEKLGQQKDKGYIAVVHIDGNNIGQRFINCQSEEELKKLSKTVSEIGKNTMTKLTDHVCDIFSKNNGINEIITLDNPDPKDKTQQILPFRPILNGGDDITFVAEGRLGIYLAQKFIEFFEELANKELPTDIEKDKIKACAGVAIVKTKFPFFKAYKLAEDLCHEAKKVSRSEPGSYISFHVANQGISGDLETIRKAELTCTHGSLTANPYALSGDDKNTLKDLLDLTNKLNVWPRNKAMELREIVKMSVSSQSLFKKQIEYRGLNMPTESIWTEEQTCYWDALQMLLFYPETFLSQLPKSKETQDENV